MWNKRNNDDLGIPVIIWHDESGEYWTWTSDLVTAYPVLMGESDDWGVPSCVLLNHATSWPIEPKSRIATGGGITECTNKIVEDLKKP